MKEEKDKTHSEKSNMPDFDNMSYKITLSVTIMTCTLFIIYGIVNIIIGKYAAGISELSGGTAVFIFNLSFLLKRKKYTAPALVINFITIILSVYLYWNGGFHNTGIFWCLVFPGLYISTRGLKKGIKWIAVHLLTLGILYLLSTTGFIKIAYNGIETLAALIVYIFACYVLITYEIIRSQYRREIHKLRELLPVCSVCKKIQDKDGNWHTVDNYLKKKADVEFSHGLCPDCVRKHYSEYSE